MPTNTMSTAQVRAARAAMLGSAVTSVLVALVLAARWLMRHTWRPLLPAYWVAGELAIVWLAPRLGVSWVTVGLLALAATGVCGGWPARSRPVRAWRAGIAAVLGGFAVGTVAAGPHALAHHPTLTVFGPTLAGVLLGWPWWHHLRTRIPQPVVEEPEPELALAETEDPDPLTTLWARRWQQEVVAEGTCTGTELIRAVKPRPGVTEALLRLRPGTKPAALMKKGTDVEVALDLDEGSVGWRSTGKAAKVLVIIAERSYIADGVPWTGPTYAGGRCELTTYADGSPGQWVFSRPGFGVLNGLVVGSTGSGKSRALGSLIANLLKGGWMVVVGDPQYGQSLPAWKNAVGEYHKGPEATSLMLRRYHAEVMRRSQMLADAGVEVFDESDPRVQALGLKPMMAVIDEVQLVLITGTPLVRLVQESAETVRKTGAGLILATQLPQMGSLGGSVRLRDALIAGNCFVMRLSNRGSGVTILPDDFVGDPFALPKEIDGKITAGMGYLRDSVQVGMLSRVAMLDEAAAAAEAPRTPVVWQVDPVDPATPIPAAGVPNGAAGKAGGDAGGMSAGDRLRAAFGVKPKHVPAAPAPALSTPEWVMACLRRGPASAQALLDRPDCPVNSAQLYATLGALKDAGRITAPAQRGGSYAITG